MPQSLANVLLHIVFSTKNRAPFLQDPAIREEMNGYMVGTLKAIECPSLGKKTGACSQGLSLAGGIRRVFGQPIEGRRSQQVYRESGGTPSQDDLPG
jgi:hypothetical protein